VVEPADIDTPIWEKSRALADSIRDDVMDDAIAKIPEEVQEHYREDLTAMRSATSQFADSAIPVSHVVRAVVHALTARRSKTRYRVGAKTWSVAFLLRNLPDRWRDQVVLKNLGMR
jgi:hypothetical protein